MKALEELFGWLLKVTFYDTLLTKSSRRSHFFGLLSKSEEKLLILAL